MLIYFLTANVLLTVLYASIRKIHHERFGEAVFFLFLPGLGFILYLLSRIAERIQSRSPYDSEAVLIRARHIEQLPEHPDVKDELNVMAVTDAVAASGKAEKRALLLKQLKRDLKENYKILMLAEEDDDTESVHYVSAAKMEIRRINQQRWVECRRDYEKEPENPDKYHAVCAILEDMIGSGVISEREADSFRKRFCDIVQKQFDTDESVISLREYEEYLGSLAELGRYEDAELLWHEKGEKIKTENTYMIMLKMFYCAKEWQKFEECLSDLRGNTRIYLSVRGLEQVGYWTNRLRGVPVDGKTEL